MAKKNRALAQNFEAQRYAENTIPFESRPRAKKEITLVPKTLTQEKYIMALNNNNKNIVVAYGPAGTGKTYLAMLAAIRALRSGECSRIILTRPAVGVEEEEHGFLPGTLVEKMAPWTRPLFDVLGEFYTKREVVMMLENEIIEIAPLAFMRGRSFKDVWIVADEMQNSTDNQMKMLLTRIGSNTKIIITGDLDQRDKKFKLDNGLEGFVDRLENNYNGDRIAAVEYSMKDVQRHPVVSEILNLYK